jgi:Tfp pilus assembly protein PilX
VNGNAPPGFALFSKLLSVFLALGQFQTMSLGAARIAGETLERATALHQAAAAIYFSRNSG